ncbi:MAG: hypothetical protein IM537_14935 [Pseudanabaena sp. M57BS1SP1A06MG]|nr:hypothetical protein [Pseudanabaena sp. M57BS1SP1A06MG]
MKYSKKEIGKALREELDKGYSIARISNWAFDLLYIKAKHQPLPEIGSILRDISAMDAGPEFEYTEKELRLLAELLINEVENPIKQINDIKSKELD